ncbi:hypothetical protein MBAV_002517, partial [Candidatus Magnetobacterium bavaricum]
ADAYPEAYTDTDPKTGKSTVNHGKREQFVARNIESLLAPYLNSKKDTSTGTSASAEDIRRNPKTGQMVKFNPRTGEWENYGGGQ